MAAEWWDVKNWSVNDLFPGAPDFNKQPFSDSENLGAYVEMYRPQLSGYGNLSRTERDIFHQRLLDAPDRKVIDEIMREAEAANTSAGTQADLQGDRDFFEQAYNDLRGDQDALEAKAAENERLGLEEVGRVRDEYLPKYDQDIARYQGILADPNKIYSDAELASQLTTVENALAGQLKEAGMTQAKQLSDSGLRASGKLTNRMSGLEQQASYLKGKNTSDLLGRVQSYLGDETTGLRGARGAFDRGLGSAESAIRAGGFADLSGLQGLGMQGANLRGQYGLNNLGQQGSIPSLNWGAGNNVGTDIIGLNLANQNQNIATGLNFFGGLAGNAMQMPSQIMPFFKGFA